VPSVNLIDAIGWWSRERGQDPAIVFGDDVLTHSAAAAWSDAVARDLRERGVQPGDRVAIAGRNSLEWCVVALGILKAGAAIVPMSYRFVADELAARVRDSEPRVIYADRLEIAKLPAPHEVPASVSVSSLEGVSRLRDAATRPGAFSRDADSPLVFVYTSGTTGEPKGVVHTAATCFAGVVERALSEPISPDEYRVLQVLPMFTFGGIVWGLFMTLARGGTMFLEPDYEPRRALQLLVRHRIAALSVVPYVFQTIAELPEFQDADLSHLKFATVGGAPVSPGLFETWHRQGVVVRQLYGMTETGGCVSIMSSEAAPGRPRSFGRGTMFNKVRIIDASGNDCAPGEPGQLIATGPTVMPGYWRNPEKTAEVIVDGWVRTGDIAVQDDEGFVTYVDRLKDMIIAGGFNIPSTELESAALELDGVLEAAAIPVPDAKWGEVPALIIATDGSIDASTVREHCRKVLSDYKVPKFVVERGDEFPRNAIGKVLKRELRDEYKYLNEVPVS
jgi:fatty-acyl-CoA synthase